MCKKLFVVSLLSLLTACSTAPVSGEASPAKAELKFVDLQSFDKDLSGSLSATLPKVDVVFYDEVVPSALPERLRTWMAAVEAGGGKVDIVPAKSSTKTRAFPLLISAISSLWSASKFFGEVSAKNLFKPAQTYDAKITLRANEHGQSFVDQVSFTQRAPK